MRTELLVQKMPKSDKPKRDDRAVKIAREIAMKAKFVADSEGLTVAEYLSGVLRPIVDRDWTKALKRMSQSQE